MVSGIFVAGDPQRSQLSRPPPWPELSNCHDVLHQYIHPPGCLEVSNLTPPCCYNQCAVHDRDRKLNVICEHGNRRELNEQASHQIVDGSTPLMDILDLGGVLNALSAFGENRISNGVEYRVDGNEMGK
ncbi:hypothetical protein EVAR_2261_1 [Eumeta japonica]|uniref:Uncharacterized protein n=1 Tax=Eumeta variegata TaxID=151549 RepID=A0A4C1SGE0_EUMVA|nr:hypothetical protein EVAR_2261_1 [Eumeta japonica]